MKVRGNTRSELITLCVIKRLAISPQRHEPRAVKRRPKGYQLLAELRHIFEEIQHRSTLSKIGLIECHSGLTPFFSFFDAPFFDEARMSIQ